MTSGRRLQAAPEGDRTTTRVPVRGRRTDGRGPQPLPARLPPVSRREDSTKRIVKWKWSLVSGECAPCFSWPVAELGQDEHGIWLGSRRGNPVSQPDGRVERQAHDGVWLIPRQQ